MLLVPGEWKNVRGLRNGDLEFDLADGTLSIVEESGEIKVRQAGAIWGDKGSQTGAGAAVTITGRHTISLRRFEITCEQGVDGWKQSGVLTQEDAGGNGTWTAEEGP